VVPGGFIIFHNVFYPRPPGEFFEMVDGLGWSNMAVPTVAGGVLVLRKPS
jgi:hypothetical protein